MKAEHEPIEAEVAKSYTPTGDEKKAIALVNKLFETAKAHRCRYDAKWLDNYKMFRGQQWKEFRPAYRHSEVINFIFQSIQSVVPILTDSRPRISYIPKSPEDGKFCEILNQMVESDWVSGKWLNELTEVIYDAHFYGAGLSSLEFDGDEDHGAGAIVYESTDPFFCFPDPDSTDVNSRGRYFLTAKPVTTDVLKAKYPEHKDHIKSDLIDLLKGKRTEITKFKYKSPTQDNRLYLESEASPDEDYERSQTLLLTLYILDDEFEEKEVESEGVVSYEQRKKYPNGRKVVIASQVVLKDGPNPYDDGKAPFQKLQNYILPREFWGISEVEQLESPQRIFNKLVSFSLDVLTLMGNPVWIVSNDSDVDVENLFNRPGLIIEKNPGSEVRREEGVQLQPFVLQLIDRMQGWFNDVAGTQDVSRGATPGSVTAASAIASLQDAAQTRLRQKSRNIDNYIQELGQQYASRAMQFYTSPRVFRLTSSESATTYFKASISTAEDGKKSLQVQRWGEQGYAMPEQYQLQADFDVTVTTGSTLPFARAEKETKLFQLFDRGLIDAEEVLKGVDFPNWQQIRDRMQNAAAAAAASTAPSGQPPPA